jgi:hypothetical protein
MPLVRASAAAARPTSRTAPATSRPPPAGSTCARAACRARATRIQRGTAHRLRISEASAGTRGAGRGASASVTAARWPGAAASRPSRAWRKRSVSLLRASA